MRWRWLLAMSVHRATVGRYFLRDQGDGSPQPVDLCAGLAIPEHSDQRFRAKSIAEFGARDRPFQGTTG
jgi:hypothetical protein